MAIRVNPGLIDEMVHFGAEDVQMCYHCGDCSAVCVHTDEVFRFPRKSMRLLQMGLETKLESNIEPWLCYYCGQCSEQCPREAEPGETMMSIRRWLISRYDFTGIARLFFKSLKAEIIAVILIGLIAGAAFLIHGLRFGDISIYDGEGAFLPSSLVHQVDILIALIVVVFLLSNVIRMFYFILIKGMKEPAPWWSYLKYIYLLPWHFISQKRYSECESDKGPKLHFPLLLHLGLMLGYVTMLLLVMISLDLLQSGPAIDWRVHILGYLASIGLLAGTIFFLTRRFQKKQTQYKKTEGSDWVFIILLFLIVITGVIQHILHRSGLYMAANIVYLTHLMVVIPWLLRMPFTKWSHIIYRPLAMYFAGMKREAFYHSDVTQPEYPKAVLVS